MSRAEIKIEKRSTADLIPSARNARTHSEEQLSQISSSIKEFGFLNPILIDPANNIIAGHGRVLAAERIGLKSVPTIVVGHLDDVQRRALAIADNKIPLNAGWDTEILKLELDELTKAGYAMDIVAFSGEEMSQLYGLSPKKGNTEDDDLPAAHPIVSRLGDLWVLGDHRLLCGSATNPKDMVRLMDGGKSTLIFTDPPYGISYESAEFSVIQGDELRDDKLAAELLIPSLREMAKHSTATAAFYVWHGTQTREDFAHALKIAGLQEKQYLIWQKSQMVLGNQDYRNTYEPCFYAAKAGQTPPFYAGRDEANVWTVQVSDKHMSAAVLGKGLLVLDGKGGRLCIKGKEPKTGKLRTIRVDTARPLLIMGEGREGTVWEVGKDTTRYVHPTQKPVELSLRAIQNSSAPGEIVLDPFLGSGSTLIGAEKLKRRCFGLDLDPKFVDTIVRRWQEFTGRDAVLEGSTRTYKSIETERLNGKPDSETAQRKPGSKTKSERTNGRGRREKARDVPSAG